ncbi:hypothetical protein D3C87_1182980 [compost metagenome]
MRFVEKPYFGDLKISTFYDRLEKRINSFRNGIGFHHHTSDLQLCADGLLRKSFFRNIVQKGSKESLVVLLKWINSQLDG